MTLSLGLENIIVSENDISLVDGQKGHLVYKGYWAKDLALNKSFEEVVFLLWNGTLPNDIELKVFKRELSHSMKLDENIKKIIELLPANVDMLGVLRTAVSALGTENFSWPPTKEQGITILAKIPAIIAYRQNCLLKKEKIEPKPEFSLTENYLYMLHGKVPEKTHVRALEAYLVLTAEHGLNASTFTSRVISSTQSDMASAITGAIGALKGPLHGGAPSEVDNMIEEIGSLSNAESWVRNKLENNEKIMGFGHRVYKTRDPRAEALSIIASGFKEPWFELSVGIEKLILKLLDEYKPGRKLYTNVEYYAVAVFRGVGIPKELYTPTFTFSRVAGWVAHILDQSNQNKLIRPQSKYIGIIPKCEE
ncbi:MAG TPA: citrate synthase/methylcitrate synthase [Bacillales bacterium]|nr:citrate synthase/methylcitrate synthase [Bacillales bacterium]